MGSKGINFSPQEFLSNKNPWGLTDFTEKKKKSSFPNIPGLLQTAFSSHECGI